MTNPKFFLVVKENGKSFTSSIWGFLFLKESINKYKITALGFILLGLIFIALA